MATIEVRTRVTRRYLMRKTKNELATMVLDLLDQLDEQNTEESGELSTEAKVVAGVHWGLLMTAQLSFARPHVIHPQMRAGLDELVEKGYLTVEKFNEISDKMVWKPTAKMYDEKPGRNVSMAFVEANSFPVTTE